MFQKYVAAALLCAPEGEGNGPDGDDREDIKIDEDDDETTTDPVDELESEPEESTDEQDASAQAKQPQRTERQPSRAERRVQALANEQRRLAEDNARLTRELHEFRQRQSQIVEDPRVEQERMALMSPEERADYRINKALMQNERNNQALAAQLMDQADRASFQSRAASDKLRQKLEPEIEREISRLRSQGQVPPNREVLFTYLVGQRALAARDSAKPAARERTARQTTRPAAGRGDATVARERRGKTAEDRLEGVDI